MECASRGSSISKESQQDPVLGLGFEANPDPNCHGDSSSYHAVGAQVAACHISDMHRSASPAAVAVLFPIELSHH